MYGARAGARRALHDAGSSRREGPRSIAHGRSHAGAGWTIQTIFQNQCEGDESPDGSTPQLSTFIGGPGASRFDAMGKAEFAESLLLMTTTPDVAVPIAGDLVQEAEARGTLWFWSTLLRTASSFAWRTFADSPIRLARAAVVGSVVQYVNAVIRVSHPRGVADGPGDNHKHQHR